MNEITNVNSTFHFKAIPFSTKGIAASRAAEKKSPLLDYQPETSITLPGILNVLKAPYETGLAAIAFAKALGKGDKEGQLDASFKLAQQPLSFLSSACSLGAALLRTGVYLKMLCSEATHYILPLSFSGAALGLGLCTIEGIFESVQLHRTHQLFKKLHFSSIQHIPNLEKITDSQTKKQEVCRWLQKILTSHSEADSVLTNKVKQLLTEMEAEEMSIIPANTVRIKNSLKEIEASLLLEELCYLRTKYFQIPSEKRNLIDSLAQKKFSASTPAELKIQSQKLLSDYLENKEKTLARRVQPWLANEIKLKLNPLISGLQDPNPAVREVARNSAKALLQNVDIQIRKKAITHIVGLIAIVLTTASLIGCFLACPLGVSLTLLILATGASLSRYIVTQGYWDSRGWHLDIVNCTPSFIRSIHAKLFKPRPVAAVCERKRQVYQLKEIHPLPAREKVFKAIPYRDFTSCNTQGSYRNFSIVRAPLLH